MIESHGIKFVSSDRKADKRATTFYDKEPKTTKWVESFTKDDIFVDIGANIGIYSLFAAKFAGQVYAVEPHLGNAYQLLRNVQANKFSNICVLCLAMGNPAPEEEASFLPFCYSDLEIGSADNQLDGSIHSVVKEWKVPYKFSNFPFADRTTKLKVDVDGIEDIIIEGVKETLQRSNRLTEILCEYNNNDTEILDLLGNYGFTLKERQLTARGEKLFKAGQDIMSIPHNMLFVR